MADVARILEDPDFQQLPTQQQLQLLRRASPEFRAMDAKKQGSFVFDYKQHLIGPQTGQEGPPDKGFFGELGDIAGGMLKTVPLAMTAGTWDPYHVVQGAVDSQLHEGKRAAQEARAGNYSQAAGHGLAAALPMVGPMAAQAGEALGNKQYGQAGADALALLGPSAMKGMGELRGRSGPGAVPPPDVPPPPANGLPQVPKLVRAGAHLVPGGKTLLRGYDFAHEMMKPPAESGFKPAAPYQETGFEPDITPSMSKPLPTPPIKPMTKAAQKAAKFVPIEPYQETGFEPNVPTAKKPPSFGPYQETGFEPNVPTAAKPPQPIGAYQETGFLPDILPGNVKPKPVYGPYKETGFAPDEMTFKPPVPHTGLEPTTGMDFLPPDMTFPYRPYQPPGAGSGTGAGAQPSPGRPGPIPPPVPASVPAPTASSAASSGPPPIPEIPLGISSEMQRALNAKGHATARGHMETLYPGRSMKDLLPSEAQGLHEKIHGMKFVPMADRIMAAHQELEAAPGTALGTPISIKDIRAKFAGVPPKTFDAAMMELGQKGKLDLVPSDAVSAGETAGLLGGKYIAVRRPAAQAPPDVGPIPF